MQCKCNISEQNLHDRENKTCEGEISRLSTNPSGDCYTILQTELIENIYDYWICSDVLNYISHVSWIKFKI